MINGCDMLLEPGLFPPWKQIHALEALDCNWRERWAAPASITVKYQRIETLGPGPAKGKRCDHAYFAIMYAAAECNFLGNGMEACGISPNKKARAEARA
jgi:hypothetical protein